MCCSCGLSGLKFCTVRWPCRGAITDVNKVSSTWWPKIQYPFIESEATFFQIHVDEPIVKLSFRDRLSDETPFTSLGSKGLSCALLASHFLADFTYKRSLFISTSRFSRSIRGTTNLCEELWRWVYSRGTQVLKRAVQDVFSPSYPAEPSVFLLLVAWCIFTRDVYPSNDGWAVILVVHLSLCLSAGLFGRKEVVVADH